MPDAQPTTSESEARLHMIRQRYGERLTSQELEEVRQGVEGIAKVAEALRAVKLDNSDEPFSIFTPYVKEG